MRMSYSLLYSPKSNLRIHETNTEMILLLNTAVNAFPKN